MLNETEGRRMGKQGREQGGHFGMRRLSGSMSRLRGLPAGISWEFHAVLMR